MERGFAVIMFPNINENQNMGRWDTERQIRRNEMIVFYMGFLYGHC